MHNNIKLAPILRKLADSNLSVKDTSISYKSHLENAWIFVGKDPIPEDFVISVNDLEPQTNRLIIRCKPNPSALGGSPLVVPMYNLNKEMGFVKVEPHLNHHQIQGAAAVGGNVGGGPLEIHHLGAISAGNNLTNMTHNAYMNET